MNVTLAEFLLQTPKDSADLARRARVLAALAQLPAGRRLALEGAVAEVCRAIAAQGGVARVRFSLCQRSGQSFVEVSAEDARSPKPARRQPASPPAQSHGKPSQEETRDTDATPPMPLSLQRLGEWLDLFDSSGWPRQGAVIRMAQALSPAFPSPSASETEQWRAMLRSQSAEDALMLAQRYASSIAIQLGHIQGQAALRNRLREATPTEHLEMLSLVASKSRNLICFLEPDGAVSWVNEAFTKTTGYLPDESVGEPVDSLLFGTETDADAVARFHRALSSGEDLRLDMLLNRRDGETLWADCSFTPIRDGDGCLRRWLAVFIDISQRRETEDALLAAKRQAEENANTKSEFLANISHEIRTPMNAIIGMTELALDTEPTNEQEGYLRTIKTSAESLLQLLNDVLDLSKIEARRLEIEHFEFNLPETIQETLTALAVRAHEKGLTLRSHAANQIPEWVNGDPLRLKQILFNLLGNAIKFTEQGEVVLNVEAGAAHGDLSDVHFVIRDTGIGIPKDKLDKVFEAFTQADSATTRQYGGTGLGLTITAELVRLLEGRIWVESEVGKGSAFYVSLPFGVVSSAPVSAPAGDPATLIGKTVLVVDDNAANRQFLASVLQKASLNTILAYDAASAWQAIEKAADDGTSIDAALLDAAMPNTDGFQLAERIRAEAPHCGPMIMISSHDTPEAAQRSRDLGFADYLLKPLSSQAVLSALLEALGGKERTKPLPIAPKPLKVLVADDQEANRKLVTAILEKRGHQCREAERGEEVLQQIEQESFDVLLLDVQMPGLDGFQTTRKIREREAERGGHLPILALTAHAMEGDRSRCLDSGMDAYLAKPLRPNALISLVESLGGTEDTIEGTETAKPQGDTSPTSPEDIEGMMFDFDAALESMDGDRELLAQQMQFFLNDAPGLIAEARAAAATKDGSRLQVAAHRLKGLVARYAASPATPVAQQLEDLGSRSDFHNASPLVEQLAKQVEALANAIRHYLGSA